MARRQRHVGDVARVPRGHDMPAGVRVPLDVVDDHVDLVDPTAPVAPLSAVHRPQVTVSVGPLIPDARVEVVDVGGAGQEPQQFGHYGLPVDPLGGQQGEALLEVEAHLVTENTPRPGAGAVALGRAVQQDVLKQLVVLDHRGFSWLMGDSSLLTSRPPGQRPARRGTARWSGQRCVPPCEPWPLLPVPA